MRMFTLSDANTNILRTTTALLGGAITVATLVAFALALLELHLPTDQAVTVAFLTLALAQLWNVFNARQPGSRLLRDGEIRNPFVWGALALCLLLLAAALWVPGLAAVLSLPTPGLSGLLLALGMSLLPLLAGTLYLSRPAAAGRV